MKQIITKSISLSKKLFYPIATTLLTVFLLKQLNMFDIIINLYHTLLPIFTGFLIAFLLQPIIDRVSYRFSRKLSVMIVYIGILIGILILAGVMIPLLYQQLLDFSEILPTWLSKIEEFLLKYHIVYGDLEAMKTQFIEEGYTIAVDSLKNIMDNLTKYGIGYITAFFISIDLDFWIFTVKKIIPNVHQFTTFYKTMSNIIYQYLVGTFLDLAFIAITTGFILYFSGFPNAMFYAVILALMNLFPYIGPTIGLIIIAIVGILSYDNPPYLSFFIIWMVQQLESNLVQPLIFNKTMNVRPILTFASIFVCDALFGIPGVILSPIFAAIVQIMFRSYIHSKTSDKVGEWEDIWYDFDEVMKKAKFDT